MHKPRWVDVIVCLVEEVEDTTSDDESEKEQQQGGEGEHTDKRGDADEDDVPYGNLTHEEHGRVQGKDVRTIK